MKNITRIFEDEYKSFFAAYKGKRCCKNCIFMGVRVEEDEENGVSDIEYECRFNPPKLHVVYPTSTIIDDGMSEEQGPEYETYFPNVDPVVDLCGEFLPKDFISKINKSLVNSLSIGDQNYQKETSEIKTDSEKICSGCENFYSTREALFYDCPSNPKSDRAKTCQAFKAINKGDKK